MIVKRLEMTGGHIVLCKKGDATWRSLGTLALKQRKIHLESTREQPATRRKWRWQSLALEVLLGAAGGTFPQPRSVQTRSSARRLQNTGIMPQPAMPGEEEVNEGKQPARKSQEQAGRARKRQERGRSIPQRGCRKSHPIALVGKGRAACAAQFRGNTNEKGSLRGLLSPPATSSRGVGVGVGLQPCRSKTGAERLGEDVFTCGSLADFPPPFNEPTIQAQFCEERHN